MTTQKKTLPPHSWETLSRLAQVWRKKGNLPLASRYYREVLALSPSQADIFEDLVQVLNEMSDWDTLIEVCREWLAAFPDHASADHTDHVHKLHIDTLVKRGGLVDAFEAHQLVRQDNRPVDFSQSDLVCCAVMRNESERLPYFLDYYRERGVARFLIVDNDSTDDSVAYLLEQPDVHVWHTAASYRGANCGAAWWELVLRRHAVGNWVLIVDADELLVYPRSENRSLADLCQELEAEDKSAYKALLVDMYGAGPIFEAHYERGHDFLESCPFLDRQYFHERTPFAGPFKNATNYWGGVRSRVFGGSSAGFLLNKVPLFVYRGDEVLCSGQHWVQRRSNEISAQRGALLHFKFFSSFPRLVEQEIVREEHARKAAVYKQYADHFADDETVTLHDPLHSVRFESSAQLAQMGIIREAEGAKHPPTQQTLDYFPTIDPPPSTSRNPRWSAMILVDEACTSVERTVRSAASQFASTEDVQIELVCERPSPEVLQEAQTLRCELGSDRLLVHQSGRSLGRPALLTHAIELARGAWVHLLNGGDWISPGFYAALGAGLDEAPEAGAALCRFDYGPATGAVDRATSEVVRMSAPLESAAAGILADWLPKVALQERVAFSAMVVKREVYESIGGFCVSAASAARWEMSQRIAPYGSVWYEPRLLAHVAASPFAINEAGMSFGLPLAHAQTAIDIAQTYLGDELGPEASAQARRALAVRAIASAQADVEHGRYRTALASLAEGLGRDALDADEVRQSLHEILSRIV